MTGSDDSTSSTRPISVAELLAKNGSIGAPPVGGRRRRRRGNADAVTVAELTGEIPIIRPDDPPPAAAAPVEQPVDQSPAAPDEVEVAETPSANGVLDHGTDAVEPDVVEPDVAEPDETDVVEADVVEADVAEPDVAEPDVAEADVAEAEAAEATVASDGDSDDADAVAEYAARQDLRDADAEPVDEQPTRRFSFGRLGRKGPTVDAEKWTPDPVGEVDKDVDKDEVLDGPAEVEEIDDEAALDTADDTVVTGDAAADDNSEVELAEDELAEDDVSEVATGEAAAEEEADRKDDELPSYLRSTEEPLFGGQTIADDVARRGGRPSADVDHADIDSDDIDPDEFEEDDFDGDGDEPRRMSPIVHGLWIVGQSVLAVVFGAGLFVAFDQLWKWNNIVALVLSVLVILGLVVGVRVVRKTEDIGSTLIAVAVGALVTLGPLALLQSG